MAHRRVGFHLCGHVADGEAVKHSHYRHEPAVDLSAPAPGVEPPLAPVEPRRPPHEAGCFCLRCWSAGLEYADYLQKKRLQEI